MRKKVNNKNRKVIVLVILSLLLLPLFNPIVEELFPNDIIGLKASSSADFYAISESELTTRWILQGAEITPVEDFHDDLSGSNWDLDGVSERIMVISRVPTDDAHVYSYEPDTNFGAWTYLWLTMSGTYYRYGYIKYEIPYLVGNYTQNSELHSYIDGDTNPSGNLNFYYTFDIDEDTLTWNNKPALGMYISTINIPLSGSAVYYESDLGSPSNYYGMKGDASTYFKMASKESGSDPYIVHYLSKNYQGEGYMYMQTNTTELVALKSQDYGSHKTLNSGDYFEVDFQTNSDSQINLILLKDGAINKSLTLSQSGNSNFNRHTVQISVDELVEFDQLKISSTFEDVDNVKVLDIKTYKYTITGDYADFYIGSKRTHSVNMSSDTYNLRIFEEEIKKIDTNITIGTSDYFYVFDPTGTIYCRLTLFNTENDYLEFTDYHIKVNRSLNEEWDEFWLLDNLFSADIESYVYISVYDRFDSLIDTFEKIASDYIDLELEVYSLKIKNLMEQQTTVDINSSQVFPILSGELIEYILSKNYYQIGYYDTNDVYKQFTIYLDSNQAYELNRSQICFLSYTDEQGNHLFFEDYKTYLNGSLIYEKVFYEEIGTDVHINITDRYDVNIYIGTYTVLASDNYIPIILEVYELKLKNMQNEFNYINITRSPYPISGDLGDIVESGHFPATYSFIDVPVGTSGNDINYITSSTFDTCEIISDYQSHKKVVKIESSSDGNMYHTLSPYQTSGTFEFYFKSVIYNNLFEMRDNTNFFILTVELRTDGDVRVKYGDGAGGYQWTDLYSTTTNFPHFKITFDCETDKVSVWCEGANLLTNENFQNDHDSITVRILRFYAGGATEFYLDAVGFSWENYNLGDNLHDSYYLGYEPFEFYNQTEIGDYAGTESFDYNTEEGVYYGTYDFRDELGNTGTDISWIDDIYGDDSTYSAEVIASEDGHKNVVKFLTAGDNGKYAQWRHTETETAGTIEFWVKYIDNGVGDFSFIGVQQAGQTIIDISFDSSDNRIYVHYGVIEDDYPAPADTLYHIKITFSMATDKQSVWLNGTLIIDDENFDNNVVGDTINFWRFQFDSFAGANSGEAYMDAYGESWDTTSHSGLGYTVGWNLNSYDLEPLLENDLNPTTTLHYGENVDVLNYLDGHNNVLRVDGITGSYIYIMHTFSSTYSDGTVEFWHMMTSTDGEIQIKGDLNMYLKMNAGYFKYYDSTSTLQSTGVVFSTDIWYHHRIDFDIDGDFDWYINGSLAVNDADMYDHTGTYINKILWHVSNNFYTYVDALGYSWDSGYDVKDNLNSHGHDVIDALKSEGWTIVFTGYPYLSVGISGEFNSHKKFLNMTDDSTTSYQYAIHPFSSSQSSGTVEFYVKFRENNKGRRVYFEDTCFLHWDNSGDLQYHDGAYHDTGETYNADQWYHIKVEFDCSDDWHLWVDEVSIDGGVGYGFGGAPASFDSFKIYNYRSTTVDTSGTYIDALAYSWISGYYVGDNYNFYDVESEYSWTTNIAPDEVVSFRLLKGFYNIWMVNSEETISYSFRMFDDTYFILNRSQMCFLSYTNQRGEYLNFNQFKTYWNGTLLYENVFYERIGRNASIEIKDHYDISVKNHSFIVNLGDNYIPVILTMYSLKVMSQQLVFNHINITRDPNYYDSDYYWSEWIAPSEIIDFRLFAGYYKINLTNNEAGSSSCYEYTLSGDDILLISSDNTIYNVLLNIANVNTTIGNQITNVQIDLTNQNSNINNSIINIDINLGNINSTLGNMLVNIDLDITNIANNISNLYVFTENSFINLGNNINTSFISIENNIISINQSISNLVIGVSSDIYLINGTISTMITQMENNLLLMNLSIDTALFGLDTTLVQIGNNITSNYILLNNSIVLANNNINDSRIAIINNLALINNTISNLISQVFSSVYMINNSIYTAVIDVGTSLSLINNTISGNLSIILQMNDALTELYRKTMFSALLNWTDIGYNTSLITSQIDAWEFINHYRNQSIEVHLRFQDVIDKLVVTANNYKKQWLPNYDTEYRLWSIKDKEYLEPWKPLPENKTVNFGFYEEEISDIPDFNAPVIWLIIILILLGCGTAIVFIGYIANRYKKKSENYRRSYADKITLEAKTIKKFSQGTRVK